MTRPVVISPSDRIVMIDESGKYLEGATINNVSQYLASQSAANNHSHTTAQMGSIIAGSENKDTPIDADYFGLMDSAAANVLKRLSWLNIKITLKAYFDTIYSAIASTRIKLAGDTTYYVRTDGSDSNDGTANNAAHAWLTLQHAIDVIAEIDIGKWTVTLQIGDGTYTAGILFSGGINSSGMLVVNGNALNPENVIISTTSVSAVAAIKNPQYPMQVQNLKVQTTTSGAGINVSQQGHILWNNIIFGACAEAQINAEYGSLAEATGNYFVSGNAPLHLSVGQSSIIRVGARTITFSNNPAFSSRFAQAFVLGLIEAYGMTFTNGNTVTGQRYYSGGNAVIYTGGGSSTYLPGNSAGLADTGLYL
jgi:hypothetical protein